MNQKYISTLVSFSKELQAHQEEILNYWTQTDVVVEVLHKHEIDLNDFRDQYAEKILNYYFGVVNGEKQIGDCPVMAAFLKMLKDHDISADELFDICTHARKSMVSVSFDLGIASKELFRDISYVFDLNFKGVLKQYSDTVYRLEKQVAKEIEENKRKDSLMFHQARLAQMGEMISNIAHQWRQPISMISAIVQNIHMKYTLGKLETEFFNKNIEDVKKTLTQMSRTISDFQNFFEPNKEKVKFTIESSIDETLSLFAHDFKKLNIQIMRHPYDGTLEVFGYPNEFAQVVLNIFQNAKDALCENNEPENRFLHIKTTTQNKNVVLEIYDNAGGIPDEVIDKIFNPYFTTKEEGKGTGIGLYMSFQIIEKNMDGKISVQNKNLSGDQKGAKFTIELPMH